MATPLWRSLQPYLVRVWGETDCAGKVSGRGRRSRVSSRFAQDGWLPDLGIQPIRALIRAIKAGLQPLQAAAPVTNHLQKSQSHDRQNFIHDDASQREPNDC